MGRTPSAVYRADSKNDWKSEKWWQNFATLMASSKSIDLMPLSISNARQVKKIFLLAAMFSAYSALCQTSVGIKLTPNFGGLPKVENPSPVKIVGEVRTGFEGEINLSRSLSSKWAVEGGIGYGLSPWNLSFSAPGTSIGSGSDIGEIETVFALRSIGYSSVSMAAARIVALKHGSIRLHAGPTLRMYNNSTFYNFEAAFNRTSSYDPDAPDLALSTEDPGGLKFGINWGAALEQMLTSRSSLLVGLRAYSSFNPITRGDLFVRADNRDFQGEFSPRAGYVGIDIGYRYGLRARKVKNSIERVSLSDTIFHKKAVFIEALGNGVLISGNFDQRFSPNRNDGFGFRAGLGTGVYVSEPGLSFARRISVPLVLNYLQGARRNSLETGVGITPEIAAGKVKESQQVLMRYFFNLGYRFQPLRKGFLLRFAWTPVYSDGQTQIGYAGLSLGYGFR
jgi:hypothetical protein